MYSKIIKKIDKNILEQTAKRCKERGIIIPTFSQLKNPELIPEEIKQQLLNIGLWDINPLNLFRINWKNDTKTSLFGSVNYFEIPQNITGVNAKILGLTGKFFPTGAHKVGAAFGCLVPRLVSGEFNPAHHKAVFPSTGNYCRGGAFDCALLGCTAVAVLPEEMSMERFDWLREIGAEIIATPGCESNVKEIYDKCNELKKDDVNVIFNQFDEFGNSIFHYNVTGPAIDEVIGNNYKDRNFFGFVCASGSAGTLAAGDYLKNKFPKIKIIGSEALQCPTLLLNGFGGHRIEGIGDKHVPWIHNTKNTDCLAAIDDEDCMRIFRLFNENSGEQFLFDNGVSVKEIEKLPLLGISSIANLLASIKTAKYFELKENDLIFTVFTDSADLYKSRLKELELEKGIYTKSDAETNYLSRLKNQKTDYFKELSYYDKKAIHNLKYFTWVEQQGKTVEELNEQWDENYWKFLMEEEINLFDELIEKFNDMIAKS